MIRYLLFLNGLAAVGSVVYHATGWGYTSLFWWADRYRPVAAPNFDQIGSATYYTLRVIEQLITFSLPSFVFVSGFFAAFAAGRSARLPWPTVIGRIRTLIIPYLLWSVLILALRQVEGSEDSAPVLLKRLLIGGAAEPYYYVPMIVQMYLLAPLLVAMVKWRATLALGLAFALQLAVQLARYPGLLGWDVPPATWIRNHAPGWFFAGMIFWFVLGVCVGLNMSGFRASLNKWRPVLPWATVALGIAGLVEWEMLLRLSHQNWLNPTPTVVDTLYSATFILTALSHVDAHVPLRATFEALGERSFGIYLLHAPILELFSRASYHTAPGLFDHQIAFQTLLVTAGVGIPVAAMTLIRRSPARPFYPHLFG